MNVVDKIIERIDYLERLLGSDTYLYRSKVQSLRDCAGELLLCRIIDGDEYLQIMHYIDRTP